MVSKRALKSNGTSSNSADINIIVSFDAKERKKKYVKQHKLKHRKNVRYPSILFEQHKK